MSISQSLQTMADGNIGIAINVPFLLSPLPSPGVLTRAPNLLGLKSAQLATGGSLPGGHNYYYYLAATDQFGDESNSSNPPIEVVVPSGTDTNQVEILGNNFVFSRNAVAFNVYRAKDNPLSPLMISSGNAIPTGAAFSWTDTGLAVSAKIAPNGSLAKVRIYWRVTGTSLWNLGAESENLFQILEAFIGSALDASWSVNEGAFAVSGGNVNISSVGGDGRACARWDSNTFGNDQWAKAVVAATGASIGVAVRMAASTETFYGFDCNGTTATLFKNVAGVITVLSSTAHATSVGDVLYLSASGSNLTASINGSVLLTAIDSSIASGWPGIQGINSSGGSLKLFQAGNLVDSLTFFVPLNLGGNTLDIQLRSVDGQGNETSQQYAPTTNYTVIATSPTIQFPAHLSYVPETNPLTATDAGSTATINIASFTMLAAGIPISVSGGSLPGLAYNTTYYVFYADPFLSGGAVTYSDSTTKSDALNSSDNFFVGSIMTPTAGAPDTIGNNDGGAGAQNGSIVQACFSLVNGAAVAGNGTVTGEDFAIDGDKTTAAVISASGNNSSNDAILEFSAPPGITGPYKNAFIQFTRSIPSNTTAAHSFSCYIASWQTVTGGGGTLESFNSGAGTKAKQTLTFPIPANINPSQIIVQIGVFTGALNGAGENISADVYDCRVILEN